MNVLPFRWAAFLTNIVLIGIWFFLFRAIYPYFSIIFTDARFRENQIILAGVLVMIELKVHKQLPKRRLDSSPHWHAPALAIALGGSVAFLVVERFLDVNTLSASLFVFATFGLAGLWMQPVSWRRGLPAALLLAGSLPFGEHLQTFIGYPARLATAEIVRAGLSGLGIPTLTTQTILVFESGISQVDLPCSGVKSLWTGWLFLLAATWFERRPINLRWIGIALAVAAVLLAANLLRVAVLVGVGQAAGWRILAEMLHLPLGILGFGAGCALGVFLLRRMGSVPAEPRPLRAQYNPAWLGPALAALLVPLLLLPGKPLQPDRSLPALVWRMPVELGFTPWALSPQEQEWLTRSGMHSTSRWRFADSQVPGSQAQSSQAHSSQMPGRLSGVLLVTTSDTWRAQHRPEQCFEVFGLKARQSFSHLAAPGFPIRLLSLDSQQTQNATWAAYWLQAKGKVTDEFAARIWADFSPDRQVWVLVTILFDPQVDPQSEQARIFFESIRNVVQIYLEGENSYD